MLARLYGDEGYKGDAATFSGFQRCVTETTLEACDPEPTHRRAGPA